MKKLKEIVRLFLSSPEIDLLEYKDETVTVKMARPDLGTEKNICSWF